MLTHTKYYHSGHLGGFHSGYWSHRWWSEDKLIWEKANLMGYPVEISKRRFIDYEEARISELKQAMEGKSVMTQSILQAQIDCCNARILTLEMGGSL